MAKLFKTLYGRSKIGVNLLKGYLPGQLVVQVTDRCNALCPQCGMRATAPFPRKTLPVEDIKRHIDKAAELGFKSISFTGGEPFLILNDLVDLINHAGKAGIDYIRTGTNGFLFKHHSTEDGMDSIKRLAEKLADTPLRNFWISMDSSVPEIHEEMRGFKGVVQGIEKAIPIFHQFGLYPSANLGINRNLGLGTASIKPIDLYNKEDLMLFYQGYRQGFQQFYQTVVDLGFTIVNACYPMSFSESELKNGLAAVYEANSEEQIVSYNRLEKIQLYKALMATIPEYRSKLRIFTPQSALHSLIHQYTHQKKSLFPCRGGIDFFFIDAQSGNTYPCGFRGEEDFGKFDEMDFSQCDATADCQACDWECFRDPSEMLGPLTLGAVNPLSLLKIKRQVPGFLKYWWQDLKYYYACGYFDGRTAPNIDRMKRYQLKEKPELFLGRKPIFGQYKPNKTVEN